MLRTSRFLAGAMVLAAVSFSPVGAASAAPAFTVTAVGHGDGSGVNDILTTWSDANSSQATSYTLALLNANGTFADLTTVSATTASYDFPRVLSGFGPFTVQVLGTYRDASTAGAKTTADVPRLSHDPLPSVGIDPALISVEATSSGWLVSWTESATSSGGGYYLASISGDASCNTTAVGPLAPASCVIETEATGDVPTVAVSYFEENPVDKTVAPPVIEIDPSTVSVEATRNGWLVSWTEPDGTNGTGSYVASLLKGSCQVLAISVGETASCVIEGDTSGDVPDAHIIYSASVPIVGPITIAIDPLAVKVVVTSSGWLVSWTEPFESSGKGSYLASFDGGSCEAPSTGVGETASCVIEGDTSGDVPVVGVTYLQNTPVDLTGDPVTIEVDPSTITITATDGGWLVSWTEPDGTNGKGSYLASFDGGSCQALATSVGESASCLIEADTTGEVPEVTVVYSQDLPDGGPDTSPVIEIDPSTIEITAVDGGWNVSWTEPHGVRSGGYYLVRSDLGICEAEVGAEGETASCVIEGDSSGQAPEVSVLYNTGALNWDRGGDPGPTPTSTIPRTYFERSATQDGAPLGVELETLATAAEGSGPDAHAFGVEDHKPQPGPNNSLGALLAGVLVVLGGAAAVTFWRRARTK